MRIVETAKFHKQRKVLAGETEKKALKKAILEVIADPIAKKNLQGEFADLRHLRYSVSGHPQKLVYKFAADTLVLFSFGPRRAALKS